TSADAESFRGLVKLRDGAEDLVRNNKYAAAAVRQVVANMVGAGISAQVDHSNKRVRQRAQDEFDRFAEGRVDGHGDLYEAQKLHARGLIVRGESLSLWRADSEGPDGGFEGLEGDYLDQTRIDDANGVRTVQGVELTAGAPSAYWLFDHHPGDLA